MASGDFETGVPNSNYSSRVKGAIGVSLDDHVLGLKVPHNPRDEQVGGIALLALLVGSEDACRARVAEFQGSRYRTCDAYFQLAQILVLASESTNECKLHWVQLIADVASLINEIPNGDIVTDVVVVGILVVDDLDDGSHHD